MKQPLRLATRTLVAPPPWLGATLLALAAIGTASATAAAQGAAAAVPVSSYGALHWRFVGPLRGGRTIALSGVASKPNLFYIAAVNGGIWKSPDAGRTWTPIFDGQPTGSIGALAVAPSDPRIIYAGSGEGRQRPDLAVGDGMYKSVDAGVTWTHLGLRDGQQISGIAVDPANPNRLFVAVLGHPYGANPERGIYRSLDGGASFTRVLFENNDVGGFAVAIDPREPSTVYATLWAARQAPWEIGASFEMAGSGVFKSTDGGTTWTQLREGLPPRIGRAEIAVAPSNAQIVYAYADVYADINTNAMEGGALYRSDDAGAHFRRVNDAPEIAQRGDDLVSIAADPRDPQTVYLTNTSAYRSTDGGVTMKAIKGAPGGDDYQNVWINPIDPQIVALASDQGATISVDDGATWSSWYNQPTAQMFHVNADDRFPYWVCGGQQESGSACVASRGNWGAVTQRDWHTAGAEEYGYVVPDPLHPGVFFGGKVQKFTERTGQQQEVSPIALSSKQYRTVRTEPLAFDHFDKKRLYFGSNLVFATENGGQSWKAISPDLTRTDPGVPAVLGNFESDDPQKGKHRGVVYALAPSYVRAGTMWAGTDDGQVWVTHNAMPGGSVAKWQNITPPGLTPWSKVAQIDASRYDDDTAFVAVTRFRLDDLRPYVYITRDGGKSWTLAVRGLPNAPVNAVRQDPVEPRLLYAATENGVAVSFDAGAQWQSLQIDLPRTSVRDLIVHGNDVVVATHGRGFWILDDVEPLRELARSDEAARGKAYFFRPERAYRIRRSTNTDTPLPPEEPRGENPPDGAILDYLLNAPAQQVEISIADDAGREVRRYSSDDAAPKPIANLDKPAYWEPPFRRPGTSAGMHRFVWDLREPPPRAFDQDLPISAVPHDTPRVPEGPLVVPGRYTVALTVDGHTTTQQLTVVMDPRVTISPAALAAQFALARRLVSLMDRSYAAGLEALNASAAALLETIDGADAPPTQQATQAVGTLESRFETLRSRKEP